MLKKIKRSIETMPRAAYIFLINNLRLVCLMLAVSLFLFASADSALADIERLRYARLFLENPAGVFLVGIIGWALLIDRG